MAAAAGGHGAGQLGRGELRARKNRQVCCLGLPLGLPQSLPLELRRSRLHKVRTYIHTRGSVYQTCCDVLCCCSKLQSGCSKKTLYAEAVAVAVAVALLYLVPVCLVLEKLIELANMKAGCSMCRLADRIQFMVGVSCIR